MSDPSPTPQPRPSNPNDAVTGAITGSFIQPQASTSGSSNLYGIDNTIAAAPVNIGGLFPAKNGATVLDAVTSFAHLSPDQIAVIQRRMWLGGYYGSSQTPPTLGVVGKDDLSAFKQAATVAAQTSTNLDQLLKSGAARGQYDGVAAQIAAQTKAQSPNQITKADPTAVAQNIDAIFQKLVGHKPSDAERAAYVTAFQAADLHVQQQNIEARNQAVATQQAAIGNAGMDPALSGALAPDTSNIPDPRTPTPGSSAAFRIGEEKSNGTYNRPDVSVDDFMRAVAGQESGGNPDLKNPDSGAYGTFQIMPGNWASWSREAGLGSNAPQTPGNQEIVARHKLQEYHDQFGTWEAAAAAWYGGPSAGQRYARNPNDPLLTRKQGKYPSIAEYVQQVNGRLNTGTMDHQPFEYSSPVTPSATDIPTPSYTTQSFNDQAFIEDKTRKDHPVETQAKDVANTFDSFLSIIGAR